MKKNILRNCIVLIICLVTTYIIFFNFVSELLIRFMSPSRSLYLSMMIFSTTFLYVISISIIEKKVSKIHMEILIAIYFCIVIGLSFFKTTSNFNGINLNPFNIIIDFKEYFKLTLLLVVTNTFLYFPLGLFVGFKVKFNNLILLIGFLLYILVIEAMQYVLNRGIFDINDIILNTLGFTIGVLCSDYIIKLSIKHKVKGYC